MSTTAATLANQENEPRRSNTTVTPRVAKKRNSKAALSMGHGDQQQQEPSSSAPDTPDAFRVVLRCRPVEKGGDKAVNVHERMHAVSLSENQQQMFTFDKVFHGTDQQPVFDACARNIVDLALEGYNGSIFAYGQTGSGKTYTMMGEPDEYAGIIPRSVDHIFDRIRSDNTPGAAWMVMVSYLEIYNEQVRDLLVEEEVHTQQQQQQQQWQSFTTPVKSNKLVKGLPVRFRNGNFIVPGLTKHVVGNRDEMMALVVRGNEARASAATTQNEHSSRSHAMLTVHIEKSVTDTVTLEPSSDGSDTEDAKRDFTHVTTSKLNLVDLAGSERHQNSVVSHKETKSINQSLSCLARVITALTAEQPSHVPYRDSKLTRLLKDSLGGNALTVMIACIRNGSENIAESLSTLRYAQQAKRIQNKPLVNEDPTDAFIHGLQREIRQLKDCLTHKGQIQEALFETLSSLSAYHCADDATSGNSEDERDLLCVPEEKEGEEDGAGEQWQDAATALLMDDMGNDPSAASAAPSTPNKIQERVDYLSSLMVPAAGGHVGRRGRARGRMISVDLSRLNSAVMSASSPPTEKKLHELRDNIVTIKSAVKQAKQTARAKLRLELEKEELETQTQRFAHTFDTFRQTYHEKFEELKQRHEELVSADAERKAAEAERKAGMKAVGTSCVPEVSSTGTGTDPKTDNRSQSDVMVHCTVTDTTAETRATGTCTRRVELSDAGTGTVERKMESVALSPMKQQVNEATTNTEHAPVADMAVSPMRLPVSEASTNTQRAPVADMAVSPMRLPVNEVATNTQHAMTVDTAVSPHKLDVSEAGTNTRHLELREAETNTSEAKTHSVGVSPMKPPASKGIEASSTTVLSLEPSVTTSRGCQAESTAAISAATKYYEEMLTERDLEVAMLRSQLSKLKSAMRSNTHRHQRRTKSTLYEPSDVSDGGHPHRRLLSAHDAFYRHTPEEQQRIAEEKEMSPVHKRALRLMRGLEGSDHVTRDQLLAVIETVVDSKRRLVQASCAEMDSMRRDLRDAWALLEHFCRAGGAMGNNSNE